MERTSASAASTAAKPRLRGVLHQYAFFLAIGCGILLGFEASTPLQRSAATIFALTVATMFGASALYNRIDWSPRWAPWIRRLDHSMVYVLIAGAYTPFGLLVLSGAWSWAVLAVVWSGVAAAIAVKLVWTNRPKWIAVTLAVLLGWVAIVALPAALEQIGWGGVALLLASGLLYTAGGIVYAIHRPDPAPAVFGYHEVFHAFVILAVACQYAAVAFFVL